MLGRMEHPPLAGDQLSSISISAAKTFRPAVKA
jgi:hypothetical protein